ncbi:hypothetical protein [Parasulfitobacter algicola]|uniref:Uncharacterized protein n=1 Tax=Parasulfitobacter algicola TaxID=2614809 RepID=A0ABX2IZU0_9RHOB|nr:hypothetical protein [Sulfitobacter algicola]NSX56289.1 hypothetical protein [Sulfitobacter algicola]
MYTSFQDGYAEGQSRANAPVQTADDTRRMIENGGTEMVMEFILDDPQMNITVRTVVPQMVMFDLMQAGPAQQDLQNFALNEASKLMAPCDGLEGDAARACIEKINFTIPPYNP